ncbi:MAG TPA: RIP metalloprotease RseP [Candidatus Paceibacterota bacterium]
MSIILFIVILLVLVIVHEFGHFITAKKSGIRVDEFGFGFPPKLFSKKLGETTYSFNVIPFGGFVKIFGENPDEESISGPDKDRSFVHKPKYIQAMVLFAGVFFNFLLAWLLLSLGFMSGLPTSQTSEPRGTILSNQNLVITGVTPKAPADLSGIKIGDKVISISASDASLNTTELNPEAVQKFIGDRSGRPLEFSISRSGEIQNLEVIPKAGLLEGRAAIGVSLDTIGIIKLPTHKALWRGLKDTSILTVRTAVSLGKLVKDSVLGQADFSAITGPVGIVGIVGDAYQFGFIYLISFAALISVNLAVINLIPFPALDGGRLLFLLIETIKGSPIKPKIANALNAVGFILLLLLMVVVTYHDIAKLL